MSDFHKILKRQITKFLNEENQSNPELQQFFNAISDTYHQFQKDKYMIERSMEISSKELVESNRKLRSDREDQELVLKKIEKAIIALALDDREINKSDVIKSEDLLSKMDILQEKIRKTKIFEEELKNSALRFQAVVENTTDLIWSVDECFRLNTFNSFFRENVIIKRKKTPELGDPLKNVLDTNDYKFLEEFLERAMEGERFTIEEVKNNNQQSYYLETSFNPIISENKVTGVSIFSRDVTTRKEYERNKTKLLLELRSANEELEQIAYITSHDLKTPLRSISSIVSWLNSDYRDLLDEDSREQIDLLLTRVKRLYHLIDNISLYISINTTDDESRQLVDMHQLLTDIVRNVDFKNKITVNIDPNMPKIATVKSQMRLLFQELIINADKHMKKDKGIITIGFKEERNGYEFRITDNGPGIDPKYHNKIFKIFQTLDVKDDSDANGIGLALVKKIIKTNGGSIRIDSDGNQGTAFHIYLPNQ